MARVNQRVVFLLLAFSFVVLPSTSHSACSAGNCGAGSGRNDVSNKASNFDTFATRSERHSSGFAYSRVRGAPLVEWQQRLLTWHAGQAGSGRDALGEQRVGGEEEWHGEEGSESDASGGDDSRMGEVVGQAGAERGREGKAEAEGRGRGGVHDRRSTDAGGGEWGGGGVHVGGGGGVHVGGGGGVHSGRGVGADEPDSLLADFLPVLDPLRLPSLFQSAAATSASSDTASPPGLNATSAAGQEDVVSAGGFQFAARTADAYAGRAGGGVEEVKVEESRAGGQQEVGRGRQLKQQHSEQVEQGGGHGERSKAAAGGGGGGGGSEAVQGAPITEGGVSLTELSSAVLSGSLLSEAPLGSPVLLRVAFSSGPKAGHQTVQQQQQQQPLKGAARAASAAPGGVSSPFFRLSSQVDLSQSRVQLYGPMPHSRRRTFPLAVASATDAAGGEVLTANFTVKSSHKMQYLFPKPLSIFHHTCHVRVSSLPACVQLPGAYSVMVVVADTQGNRLKFKAPNFFRSALPRPAALLPASSTPLSPITAASPAAVAGQQAQMAFALVSSDGTQIPVTDADVIVASTINLQKPPPSPTSSASSATSPSAPSSLTPSSLTPSSLTPSSLTPSSLTPSSLIPSSLLQVSPGEPSADASGPLLVAAQEVTVGQTGRLTVYVRDAMGSDLSAAPLLSLFSASFSVTSNLSQQHLTYPATLTLSASPSPEPTSPSNSSSLDVTFDTGTLAGAASLSVLLSGRHIRGSPFPFTVLPGPLHPPSSLLYGPGAHGAVPKFPAFLQLQLRDAWGNVLLAGGAGQDVQVGVVPAAQGAAAAAALVGAGGNGAVQRGMPAVAEGAAVSVVDSGNGCYSISYRVTKPGAYALLVTVGDVLLQNVTVAATPAVDVSAGSAAAQPTCVVTASPASGPMQQLLAFAPPLVQSGAAMWLRIVAVDAAGMAAVSDPAVRSANLSLTLLSTQGQVADITATPVAPSFGGNPIPALWQAQVTVPVAGSFVLICTDGNQQSYSLSRYPPTADAFSVVASPAPACQPPKGQAVPVAGDVAFGRLQPGSFDAELNFTRAGEYTVQGYLGEVAFGAKAEKFTVLPGEVDPGESYVDGGDVREAEAGSVGEADAGGGGGVSGGSADGQEEAGTVVMAAVGGGRRAQPTQEGGQGGGQEVEEAGGIEPEGVKCMWSAACSLPLCQALTASDYGTQQAASGAAAQGTASKRAATDGAGVGAAGGCVLDVQFEARQAGNFSVTVLLEGSRKKLVFPVPLLQVVPGAPSAERSTIQLNSNTLLLARRPTPARPRCHLPLTVLPAPPAAALSYAFGPGLERTVAGAPSTFTLQTRTAQGLYPGQTTAEGGGSQGGWTQLAQGGDGDDSSSSGSTSGSGGSASAWGSSATFMDGAVAVVVTVFARRNVTRQAEVRSVVALGGGAYRITYTTYEPPHGGFYRVRVQLHVEGSGEPPADIMDGPFFVPFFRGSAAAALSTVNTSLHSVLTQPVNQPLVLLVTTADQFGNPLYDGTCLIAFTPPGPGPFLLSIRLFSQHVPGSPFLLSSVPGPVAPELCDVWGSGLGPTVTAGQAVAVRPAAKGGAQEQGVYEGGYTAVQAGRVAVWVVFHNTIVATAAVTVLPGPPAANTSAVLVPAGGVRVRAGGRAEVLVVLRDGLGNVASFDPTTTINPSLIALSSPLTIAGSYQLQVLLNGSPLPSPPLALQVVPAAPASFSLSGFPPAASFPVARPVIVHVALRDRFGNLVGHGAGEEGRVGGSVTMSHGDEATGGVVGETYALNVTAVNVTAAEMSGTEWQGTVATTTASAATTDATTSTAATAGRSKPAATPAPAPSPASPTPSPSAALIPAWRLSFTPQTPGQASLQLMVGPPNAALPLSDPASALPLQATILPRPVSLAHATLYGAGLQQGGGVRAGTTVEMGMCVRDAQGFPLLTESAKLLKVSVTLAFFALPAPTPGAFLPVPPASAVPRARMGYGGGCIFRGSFNPPNNTATAAPSAAAAAAAPPYGLSVSVLVNSRPVRFQSTNITVHPALPPNAPLPANLTVTAVTVDGVPIPNGYQLRGGAAGSETKFGVRFTDASSTAVLVEDDSALGDGAEGGTDSVSVSVSKGGYVTVTVVAAAAHVAWRNVHYSTADGSSAGWFQLLLAPGPAKAVRVDAAPLQACGRGACMVGRRTAFSMAVLDASGAPRTFNRLTGEGDSLTVLLTRPGTNQAPVRWVTRCVL
ncbi:unnamed protein product [Closterium sp. Yama58-4]|nr:unnamed protein product [Closterium sp. Yama58-4]